MNDVTVREISREIEKFAPIILKEDYDNVGLMVGDNDKKVKKVLLALDCTKNVIDEAVKLKCDMIITHHPLFFRKPKNIVKGDLLGDKVIALIKEDISLYSCHTNLDSAKGGINETIVNILGFNNSSILEPNTAKGYGDCGIGRFVELKEKIKFDDVIKLVKEKLNLNNLRVIKGKEDVTNIAVINGSGQDFFEIAKRYGADCIITGDTTYHFVSDYKELGINIIDAGHFGTEYIVFIKTLEFLSEKFKNVQFIKSVSSSDPYEFI